MPSKQQSALCRHATFRRVQRGLHARHSKGTATAISGYNLHLSPCHGLLLYGSPALEWLWQDGSLQGASAASRLARALFHRHDDSGPLRPTRNRSLPAAHLHPSLQAQYLGLALRRGSAEVVRRTLLDNGIAGIAKDTRVSIAHFERLCALLTEATVAVPARSLPSPRWHASARETAPSRRDGLSHALVAGLDGVDVFLAYVWATATSKADLRTFLHALSEHVQQHHHHNHRPVDRNGQKNEPLTPLSPGCEHNKGLDGSTLFTSAAALPWSDDFSKQWETDVFGAEVHYLLGGGSVAVAPSAPELEHLHAGRVGAAALERLAFTAVARHGCAPEVVQEHHGWRGQPPMADCVEACLREALGLALWDPHAGRYRPELLPPTADPEVVRFFAGAVAGGDPIGGDAGRRWYDLCSGRPGLHYMLGTNPEGRDRVCGDGGDEGSGCSGGSGGSGGSGVRDRGGRSNAYELFPSPSSYTVALSSLLRQPVTPPGSDALRPVWPGSLLEWRLEGCERHPVIVMRRRRAPPAPGRRSDQGGSRDDKGIQDGGGQDDRGGSGGGSGGGGHPNEETLRLTFHGQRHCYMMRDAALSAPAWLHGVRSAWLALWEREGQLPRLTRAAAARLLVTAPHMKASHKSAEADELGPRERPGGL